MWNSILKATLALPLLALATHPGDCLALQPGESFGFSSDDNFNGNSYLGVDTRDITPDRVAPLQLKEEAGVEITMVDQDAPAGKAGLKEHDVILTVNGEKVESVEQLRRMIHEIPSGRMIDIGISREGKPQTLKAQLAARKGFGPSVKAFNFSVPPMPPMPAIPEIDVPVSVVVVHSSARSGLLIENLSPQLGDYFGAKGGQGVLVRSVEKGSHAETAGFHAGDVIVKVNGEAIHDAGEFTRSLRSRHGEKDSTVSVGIIRDKKEQTITLSLPERKQSELDQETFELPEAKADIELADIDAEIAQLGPQVQLATQEVTSMLPEIEKDIQVECLDTVKIKKEIDRQMMQLKKVVPQKMERVRKQMSLWVGADI